ncbi:hypothetical protein C8J56DRAFT_893768 [Mycena floridula]|nr:hypothetical protein C8J56DRAFT_893768 [Mycena floridula]
MISSCFLTRRLALLTRFTKDAGHIRVISLFSSSRSSSICSVGHLIFRTTFFVQHPENLSHPRAPIPLGAMSTGVALDARKIGGDGDPFAYRGFTSAHPPNRPISSTGRTIMEAGGETFHSSQQEERVLLVFFYSTNTLPPDFAGCKLYDVLASKGDGRELGSGTTKQPSSSTLLMGAGLILMLVSAERTKREPLMRYYLHLVSDIGLPTTTKQFEGSMPYRVLIHFPKWFGLARSSFASTAVSNSFKSLSV